MRRMDILACILAVCIYCNLIPPVIGKKTPITGKHSLILGKNNKAILVREDYCMRLEPDQNTFCKSHFVIRALVIKSQGKKKKIRYFVKVKDCYKFLDVKDCYKLFSSQPKPVKAGRIITTNNPCGVQLKDGTTYIISGLIDKRVMTIHQNYSIVIEDKDLTTIQRRNFDYAYYHNCGCKVNVCQYNPCPKTASSCSTTVSKYNCYNQFSACVKQSGTCQWEDINRQTREYDPDCEMRSDLPAF